MNLKDKLMFTKIIIFLIFFLGALLAAYLLGVKFFGDGKAAVLFCLFGMVVGSFLNDVFKSRR